MADKKIGVLSSLKVKSQFCFLALSKQFVFAYNWDIMHCFSNNNASTLASFDQCKALTCSSRVRRFNILARMRSSYSS